MRVSCHWPINRDECQMLLKRLKNIFKKKRYFSYMTTSYVAHEPLTHTHSPSPHFSVQRHHLTLVSHSAGGLDTNTSGIQMRTDQWEAWKHGSDFIRTQADRSLKQQCYRWTHSWRWQMQDAGWRWGNAPHHCCLHSGWADHRPASPGSDICH